MNSKKLITMSLVGLSCLAVTASFIALSNHNVIRPVQSGSQNRNVVMNKNTIYQKIITTATEIGAPNVRFSN